VPDAYVVALVEISAENPNYDRVGYLPKPYGPDIRLPFETTHHTRLAGVLAAGDEPRGCLMATKLIEVALPLDAINREAAREKSIRHGHPSTLHLWWARRPLAACRAVLFAQLVDDPSGHPELFPTEADQERERLRLFDIIERLVPWEASTDERILEEARTEIRRWYSEGLPPIVDPFCGGGSIPLEAQRLGLEALASDLNPVAVLITRALIELPPKFADRPPAHPDSDEALVKGTATWRGAQGLAEDVRYYGKWMRDEAKTRIGAIYPDVELPGGKKATVIAWLWARTVVCPNPACRATIPLVRSFWLGKKKGKEAWVRPVIEGNCVRFEVGHGSGGPPVEGTVGRNGARCLVCGSPVPLAHVRAEGKAQRLGSQLMAVVAEGDRQRVYLPPNPEHVKAANVPRPEDVPDTDLPEQALSFRVQGYGMTKHADLFTNRQLTALCTLSDLIEVTRERVIADTAGDRDYADAVATYLAFAVDRCSDYGSTITTWASHPKQEAIRNTFSRQAIPMTWDFGEANFFADAAGSLNENFQWIAKVIERLVDSCRTASVTQQDAATRTFEGCVISTDPPYYDNIGYADLSDYFYVWLRRSLRKIYPELLGTLLTPKSDELIATPYRFDGDKHQAEIHFETGFAKVFANASAQAADTTPMTIFYAFKQSETDESEDGTRQGRASTGWEKMLEGLLRSGVQVTGTWPMRTELGNRMLSSGTNALASSIVLVCRRRPLSAGVTDRRGFIQALKGKLVHALRDLQSGAIAPVDLAQAAIGPGMAVFSSFAKVVEPSGEPMRVRTALALINQVLDEVSAEQEGEFDEDTRWAIAWYAENGMDEGSYGRADDLSRAKNVSVDGLVRAGLVKSGAGRVRLSDRDELDPEWDPTTDDRLTVWKMTQYLIQRLLNEGEASAAQLLARAGGLGDAARDLAYRLFQIAEAKRWAKEAGPYNALAASWLEISRLGVAESDGQGSLF
jgi:putative DNA methylase